ncbi:MAG: hypothetical protein P8O20_01375, partial [Bacteroidia bacterium]|nr:hypothetical protein [Bacteroidia bacterium]
MNKLPFNSIFSMVALGAIILFSSCEKDKVKIVDNTASAYTLEGTYSESKVLTADQVWMLKGRVIFKSGTKLTIEPGTIIKAEGGTGANASVIIIARGATISAEGTATQPIIFTSVADDIIKGQIAGTNLNPETIKGLWGGLIVLGDAPISPKSGTTWQIEGVPGDVIEGNYGGDNGADNSGVIKYVSVRFGGALIGEGNEINGITLGGVGNGTVIENVEVVGNIDDGIEFFGGTVNVKNAAVAYQGDDAFDVDEAYSGTLDNFMYVAGSGSDHGMEIDGPAGSANSTGAFTFKNGVLKGLTAEYADFRDGARGTIENCYFFGFNEEADFELDDDVSSNNFKSGDLSFSGVTFNAPDGITLADIVKDKSANAHAGEFATEFAKNN